MTTRRPAGEGSPVPTVADIVGATVARAGAALAFAQTAGDAGASLGDALARSGVRVVPVGRAGAACAMAAVAGWLGDAPAAALLARGDADELVPALRQAWRDRAPLVAVTQGPLDLPADGVVKASLAVRAETAAHWSAHACQLALTEPRGPVHLVVAPDAARARAVPLATAVRPAALSPPTAAALDLAADLLAGAQRPVVIAGGQCRTHEIAAWLRALVEALPAPVLVTRRGKGALPDPHPLNLGLVGAGTAAAALLARADLAVALGVDAPELSAGSLPPELAVLHLAALPWGGPTGQARLDMVGEIAPFLEELAPRLRGRGRADWDVAELDRIKRAAAELLEAPPTSAGVARATAVRIAREATPAGTLAIVAAGEATDAIAAGWPVVGPGELLIPAAPCVPGFALPAAIAAAMARPQVRVVAFAGAGQAPAGEELDIAARLGQRIVLVLVADGDEAAPLLPLAHGAGWTVAAVRDGREMGAAMERALRGDRPSLLALRG